MRYDANEVASGVTEVLCHAVGQAIRLCHAGCHDGGRLRRTLVDVRGRSPAGKLMTR